jgi:hypothetical protein
VTTSVSELLTGGFLVFLGFALAQGMELLRGRQARRQTAAKLRHETYGRFLNELSEIPYSYNRAVAGAPEKVWETADEMGRRLVKLRVAVVLVGSGAVARVADEFQDHFQKFTMRRLELDGDDSERHREARDGVRANTFAAYKEVLDPYVARLASAMRKDWS